MFVAYYVFRQGYGNFIEIIYPELFIVKKKVLLVKKKLLAMKKHKFYDFLLKDDKRIGVLYAPKGTDTLFGRYVFPVEGYQNMEFTLRGGRYVPFMNSNVRAHFINEELKLLIEENIPEKYPLEFLPIKTVSEEYGDNLYYIIHFIKIFDVIDEKNSIKIPGTDSIVKPYIDYEKAKDLIFFNSEVHFNDIIITDTMRKLMKKHKLDTGIIFREVPYV